MAEETVGQRREAQGTPWRKLFSGFKVALDPKKLLLAAAGILVMAFGWWILAVVFFDLFSSNPPEFRGDTEEAWRDFRAARQKWNLRHEMAGNQERFPDAGDVASTLSEFKALDALHRAAKSAQQSADVTFDPKDLKGTLTIDGKRYGFTAPKESADALQKISKVPVSDVRVIAKEKDTTTATISGVRVTLDSAEFVSGKTLQELRAEYALSQDPEMRRALQTFDEKLARGIPKPYGKLRYWPWWEPRGPNPYLLATGKERPWEVRGFLSWLARDQIPVLLEPLYKFISPILYLLDPGAGFMNRVYLLLIILWTLATWAIFGGAITRLAAVQVARPNEKVGLGEAFAFARNRFQSYFSAPLFPLMFLAFFTIMLIIFGLFEGLIPIVGDIFIAGLLWPIVLISGLVMAVVLVGLIGWPLMYATISAEGSDSFDALSRSYSYVYQAPWHYVWYSFLALVYGAVLVFFVGFMASLTVYLGKWGVSQAPFLSSTKPEKDREPSYLFIYAPTSFGWRDLMLSKSDFTVRTPKGYDLSPEYRQHLTWYNRLGAGLVGIWLGLFFLLIVGFGYSYFWSAATIIYLLMRHKVDDTEIDEIHLEEEDEEPMMPPPSVPPADSAAPPATQGVTMVEAPTLRTPSASPPPASSPPDETPPSSPPSP